MWDSSRISGPLDANGNKPPAGYAGPVWFVIPVENLTAPLAAIAIPLGTLPPLGGETCKALPFASETAAKTLLSTYWTADVP
jgi:hypothetical protein